MSTQIFSPQIKGYAPLLDRKKAKEPYVLEGKNFTVDANGPMSNLGRNIISYKAIPSPKNIQVFEISETIESLICTNEGIFRLDTRSTRLVPLYEFTAPVTTEFPWSLAAVGNKYYFARKGYNLIEYDIYNDSWTELSGGSIPSNIYACAESEGRLILLTDIWVAWSAIGVGSDFAASTVTGAGAQALTKLGQSNPIPLGVQKVPDGFLTFTSSGIMKSQAINSLNPFRHTILSYQHIPINPYCIATTVAQSIVILTKAGLFETAGKLPSSWQPLMSEYLHTSVLPQLDVINNQNNVQIHFDFDTSWFIISISESQQEYLYTKGLLLNIPINEWGIINTPYVALDKFKLLPERFEGFDFGLVDPIGNIFVLNAAQGIEYIPPLDAGLEYYKVWEEQPARKKDNTIIFTCKSDWRNFSNSGMVLTDLYNLYSEIADLDSPEDRSYSEKASVDEGGVLIFKENNQWGFGLIEFATTQVPAYYTPLDSFVYIGPYRLYNEQQNDRYSYITNVSLGMDELAVGDTSDDWGSLLLYPVDVFEDYELLSGFEDWGVGTIDSVNYNFKLIPSLDGYKQIPDSKIETAEILTQGKSQFYSCYSMGLYHILNIEALELTENYHLKTVDMTVNFGGRI